MAGRYDEVYGVNPNAGQMTPQPGQTGQPSQPQQPQQSQQPQQPQQPQQAGQYSQQPQQPQQYYQPLQPQPHQFRQPSAQPQQPVEPSGEVDGLPKYQVHHSYVWLGTIQGLLAVFLVLMIGTFSSISALLEEIGMYGIGAFGVVLGSAGALFLVLGAIVLLVHMLAYKRLYFTLGPNEFSLYSGIVTKKRVHVPYDRVQSVDARASLIQRIFGVRNVFIDTAGGASNKAVLVPYLTKAQAEWLTSELYARKRQALQPQPSSANVANPAAPVQQAPVQATPGNVLDVGRQAWDEVGGVFAGAPVHEEAPSFEYGLTNGQLFLAGLSNNTSFVLLVLGFIGVIGQLLDLASGFFPSQTDMAIDSFASHVIDPMFSFGVAFSIVGIIVLLAIFWVLSAVSQCISFGGFRARRMGDRIEVERGLLQHTRQSISIQRVQAVVVKQSVIRRLIGYCEVSLDKIDAATGEDTSQGNSLNSGGVVIHPFCKLADVPTILQGLVPEYAAVPQGRTPVAPVALRRAIIRRCIWQGFGFWLAVFVAICQIVLNLVMAPNGINVGVTISAQDAEVLIWANNIAVILYVIAAVMFILEMVSSIKWARESGFAVNDRFMKMVNGGLSREERSFPRNKIQYGFTKTNPFQRMSKVATINVRTAAGVGGTSVDMKDVRFEDADDWLAWLEPRH